MRILVTGGAGQLGNELRRCLSSMLAEIGPIPDSYRNAEVDYIDYQEMDIASESSVQAWFAAHGPYDIVIACAALTNVDGCETNPQAAFAVNAQGAEYVARAAASSNAKLVHVSTDYVFAGNEAKPRIESDATNPQSVYGASKLEGEELALAACSKTFIVRTAWLYGYVGKNFVKTMLRLAREQGRIRVVDDQFGNPTNANDLAYEILQIAATENYGIYHCTNEGVCSWYEFACAIVDGAGIACEKTPCSSDEFETPTERPKYSALRNKHLDDTIGNEMRSWQDALATYLENLPEWEG